jgi:putative DNA primase/helicase
MNTNSFDKTGRPSGQRPDFNCIPDELKALAQWVCWRWEKRNGKPTKPLFNPNTGRHAKSSDSTTWVTFQEALRAYGNGENYSGIGFVFSANDPYCGVDLDDYRNPDTCKIDPWAEQIIARLNSYTEISPSGKGFKIFLRGTIPPGGNRKGQIEMYDKGRYFTLTGMRLASTPKTIEDRSQELRTLHTEIFNHPQPDTLIPGSSPDVQFPHEKLEALLANDEQFKATWERQRTDLPSQSEYDLSLATIGAIANFSDSKIAALIYEHRRRHGQDVLKAKRPDYIAATITKARLANKGTSSQGDPGLTKELADAILDHDHFACDAGRRIYVFRKGVYELGGEEEIKKKVKKHLENSRQTKKWTKRRAEEVIEYIKVDTPELWPEPPCDRINVLNGLLDVNTLELLPHDYTFLSPIRLPVAYDPAATCSHWKKFVAETFPEDAREVAWELVAWLMTPNTDIQKAVLLWGNGSNGKSTFLRALSTFIDKRNIAGLSLHKMEVDRFAASRLVGKLANICPDLPSSKIMGTSVFKALTGGDNIHAERKYAASFEFTPFVKLIFSANHPPRSNDASVAFFRRWLVIPFLRTFEGSCQIPRHILDEKLANPRELSGVLNKALEALPGLQKDGFQESETMRDARNEFHETTDVFGVWLKAKTILASNAFIPKDDLSAAYNATADARGCPALSKTAFTQRLKGLYPNIEEKQRKVHGKIRRVWVGIGWKAKESQE